MPQTIIARTPLPQRTHDQRPTAPSSARTDTHDLIDMLERGAQESERLLMWNRRAAYTATLGLGLSLAAALRSYTDQLRGPAAGDQLFLAKALPSVCGPAFIGAAYSVRQGADRYGITVHAALGAWLGSVLLRIALPSAVPAALIIATTSFLMAACSLGITRQFDVHSGTR